MPDHKPSTPPRAPLAPHDALRDVLERVAVLQAARGVEEVLRAAVECAVAATGATGGRAGLFDGETATSDARYEAGRGWAPERSRWRPGEGAPGRACGAGEVVRLAGDDPEGGAQAQACTPIVSAGAVVGFLLVAGPGRAVDDDALERLRAVARLAEHGLESAAAAEGRLADAQAQADLAGRLQRQLLPPEPPELEGLDVAFEYRSASPGVLSGGDFVDYYVRPPSDNLAFAIGDVAGKGAEAMAHTFVAKFILRAAVHGGQVSWPTHPGSALQELRTGLLEQPDFGAESERFVTVLFGLISPRRRLLQLSSAGHPTPFLVRAHGVERPLLLTEPAVGVELGAALEPYPTETLDVEPGDVLVLFTDGIAELRDAGGRFFEDQMAAVLEGCHDVAAAEVVRRLLRAAEEFSARPPADDLALLCIRLRRDSVN